MINIRRLSLPAYSPEQIENILGRAVEKIVELVSPRRVIAFGSSVAGKFDDASDLDFVIVFDTPESAKAGRKILYRNGPLEGRTADFICVDEKTYEEKSALGGIYFVAATEGRTLFPE